METVDIQAVESKLSDVTVTAIPMNVQQSTQKSNNLSATSVSSTLSALSNKAAAVNGASDLSIPATIVPVSNNSANKDNVSKYVQLLLAIEEMGREVRPTYAGSRSSAERLKRGIIQARVLVRECLLETERSARQ